VKAYIVEYFSINGESLVMAGEKHDKFRELAEARTSRALDSVRKIGNLSNRQLYDWEDGEVRKIIKALKDAIADVERKFSAPKASREKNFKR
jgi:hypothetical protein